MKKKITLALVTVLMLASVMMLSACYTVIHDDTPQKNQELASYLEQMQTNDNYTFTMRITDESFHDSTEIIEIRYAENKKSFSIYTEGYDDEAFLGIIIENIPEEDVINGYLGNEYGWAAGVMPADIAAGYEGFFTSFTPIIPGNPTFFDAENYTYDEENDRFIFDITTIEDEYYHDTFEIYITLSEGSMIITMTAYYGYDVSVYTLTYSDFGTTKIAIPTPGAILPMPEGDLQQSLDKLTGANMSGVANTHSNLGGLSLSFKVTVCDGIIKIGDGYNMPEYLEINTEERILYRYYTTYNTVGYAKEAISFDKLFGEGKNGEFLFDADSYEFSQEKGCYMLKKEFIPKDMGILNISISFMGDSVFFAIDTISENGDISFFSIKFNSFGETEEITLPEING